MIDYFESGYIEVDSCGTFYYERFYEWVYEQYCVPTFYRVFNDWGDLIIDS